MTFTTADYLKLAGTVHFNAIPDVAADVLLSAAPLAAFGFIGSNPTAINFKGGQLTVASGTGVALVGGDINLLPLPDPVSGTASSITAHGRPILLTSVAGRGEVLASNFEPAPSMTLGTITLGHGSLIDVSGNAGGTVRIRGGTFVMDQSVISADTVNANGSPVAIDINVTENVSVSTVDVPALTARTTGTGNAGSIQISSGSMDVTATTGESFLFSLSIHIPRDRETQATSISQQAI